MTRFSDSQPIRSVLIVEDTDADAAILQTQLSRFGSATILSVRDVSLDAAIKRLAKTRFDVIIADLNLPGSTPAEVMERLPAACRTAALIVVSAMTPDLLSAAMDSKIEGVLPKTGHSGHETLEAQVVQAVTRKQSAIHRRTRMRELEQRVDHQDEEISALRENQATELRAIRAANNAQVAEFKAQIVRLEGQGRRDRNESRNPRCCDVGRCPHRGSHRRRHRVGHLTNERKYMEQQIKKIQWPTAVTTIVFVVAILTAYLAGPALGVPEDSHKALVAAIGALGVPVLAMMQKMFAPQASEGAL